MSLLYDFDWAKKSEEMHAVCLGLIANGYF